MRSEGDRRRDKERIRRRKAEARAAGICINCRQDFSVEGLVYCIDCQEVLAGPARVLYSTETGYAPAIHPAAPGVRS